MSLKSKISKEDLQKIFSGDFNTVQGHLEIPSELFVSMAKKHGLGVIPPIPLFGMRDGKLELYGRGDRLADTNVLSNSPLVYVSPKDKAWIRRFTEKFFLDSEVTGSLFSKEEKLTVLYEATSQVVNDLFRTPTPEAIDRGIKVANSLVNLISNEPNSHILLTDLSKHDPYTVKHSIGTSVVCVLLSKKIGINKPNELMDAALAGLFHDIGKSRVPIEIINKPGPLDPSEWAIMKRHPEWGLALVKNNPAFSDPVKDAIFEHHEDKEGKGYPVGHKLESLGPLTKLVALADTFNALTTDRPYAKGRTPFDALKFINEKLLHKIDESLLRELIFIYSGKYE